MVSASESGRLRAGVVGAGHMGQYHILALAARSPRSTEHAR